MRHTPLTTLLSAVSNNRGITMKKITLIITLFITLLLSSISDANTELSSSLSVYEIESQKGTVSTWYSCGDTLRFMFLYQPVMTKSQSYQTAEGMFILFRVLIANDSAYTYSGFKNDSFHLLKETNGFVSEFPLSGGHSRITSKAWEIDMLQDKLLGSSQKDTFLVFDVEGKYNDTWILDFSPIEKGKEDKICTLKVSLPPVSYQK